MMTEKEKNTIVATELFGDNNTLKEEVLENRLVDWDKAYTCIFYNKKSVEFEQKGENVYSDIRKRNELFLEDFKNKIQQLNDFV